MIFLLCMSFFCRALHMFDEAKLRLNRLNNLHNISNSSLYHFVRDDVFFRLSLLDFSFSNVLLIHTNAEFFIDKIKNIESIKFANIKIVRDFVHIDFQKASFDCIIFPLGIYWINDLPNFLKRVNNILSDDGVFVSNFPAGQSLSNLRYELIRLETKYEAGHYLHILPLIKFDDVTKLLSQAGFHEHVIDLEKLKLDFKSPLLLMKELKKIGESNIFFSPSSIPYSINKNIYFELENYKNESFIDYIELVSFVATKRKNTLILL